MRHPLFLATFVIGVFYALGCQSKATSDEPPMEEVERHELMLPEVRGPQPEPLPWQPRSLDMGLERPPAEQADAGS